MNIDKATLADRETIFGLHVDSVTHLCVGHYSQAAIDSWFVGRTSDNYTGAIEYGGVWLAKHGAEPVGFVEVFPGMISMMFVGAAFAGKGIGGKLMHFALERATEEAGLVVSLESTLNAQVFYERYGFQKVGDGKLYRASGVELPTVLMEKGHR
jgi:GNAT superfamily N-acetyltransferase